VSDDGTDAVWQALRTRAAKVASEIEAIATVASTGVVDPQNRAAALWLVYQLATQATIALQRLSSGPVSAAAVKALARGVDRWPFLHSAWPDDEGPTADYLKSLSVGADTPFSKKGQKPFSLMTTGNRWALCFVRRVQLVHFFRELVPAADDEDVELAMLGSGVELSHEDFIDALALPPPSFAAIEQFKTALWRHIDRHWPAKRLLTCDDWKGVAAQHSSKGCLLKDDPEAFVRQVKGKLTAGLKMVLGGYE
jgi:hypothetical protein